MRRIALISALFMMFSHIIYSQVDVSVENVYPNYIVVNKQFKSAAKILNNDTQIINDVDVLYELLDAAGTTVLESQSDNYTGLNLNNLDEVILESTVEWTVSTAGNYKLRATVTVAGDTNTANNILEIDANVIALDYSNLSPGEGYVANSTEFSIINNPPTGSTPVSTFAQPTFLADIDFVEGTLYGVVGDLDPVTFNFVNYLVIIDGDGTMYQVGEIILPGSLGAFINGFSYDSTTGITYLLGDNPFIGSFYLPINLSTLEVGAHTVIGTNFDIYVAIEFDNSGTPYVLNLATNHVDVMDISTGAVTPLPNITGGTIASINLGMSYNETDDTIYLSLYDSAVSISYYSLDATSGIATQLFSANDEFAAVIAFPPVSLDSDNDGILDVDDNCVDTPNPDQADWNNNGIGDACEDSDNDGILDIDDNCVDTPNSDQADWNNNGIGDACEDSDNDGILDIDDNCVTTPNSDQADWNNNGIGDACEDFDNDGIFDIDDNCITTPNSDQADSDNNGIGDACDGIFPNDTITPNGDGINDTWGIVNIDLFPNNSVKVFSRWGVKVYEAKNYNSFNEWNAESTEGGNGRLPVGSYYYIIETNENGLIKSYTGWLYINY